MLPFAVDGFSGPLIIIGIIVFVFLLIGIIPFRRTIFKIVMWVAFAAAIVFTYIAMRDGIFPLADKYLVPILSNKHHTYVVTCIAVLLLSTVMLFICPRIHASADFQDEKLSKIEQSREGLKYITSYDSAGNAWAKPYYDDGVRYDDTENFGAKARLAKLFGFWFMIFIYFIEIATPVFFVLGMPKDMEDAEVLEYFPSFITEEKAAGFTFFMCVVMVIAIIIQIVIYRVLLKAYVKRILKKSDK